MPLQSIVRPEMNASRGEAKRDAGPPSEEAEEGIRGHPKSSVNPHHVLWRTSASGWGSQLRPAEEVETWLTDQRFQELRDS